MGARINLVTHSRGNVFEDVGFVNHEAELIKCSRVSALIEVSEERGLTQAKVAELLRVDQPTISKLFRGRTGGFTCDRLMHLLTILGQDVDIAVRPTRFDSARITVSVAHIL